MHRHVCGFEALIELPCCLRAVVRQHELVAMASGVVKRHRAMSQVVSSKNCADLLRPMIEL